MAKESEWLEKWAYAARWFVLPISFGGWLLAGWLALVFGVPELGHPEGYRYILLIFMSYDLHHFVPPWLAYFYNATSVLVIATLALIGIQRIVTEERP